MHGDFNSDVFPCSTRPWDPERCLVQFEKDGVIQTHEKTQRRHNGLSYSHSWTSQQKVSQMLTQISFSSDLQKKKKVSVSACWFEQSFAPSQAEVNGKHRKTSSQPSSCSQNTESSSTTPEPTHESSDNEGEESIHTLTHGLHLIA